MDMEELENSIYDYFTAMGKNSVSEALEMMKAEGLDPMVEDVKAGHWRMIEDVTGVELDAAAAAVRARLEREHADDLED